ncbi:NADH-quinone oxidoreductase subunit L [Halarcobacter mediterraneus]|uniref:NADH-ubiquinone oxidoreductase chain 5 n=1 Tax=Halarcobacter mediterraneus TaxID=2023153 RepID=A0A4Q1AQ99_9BACT|nr:NADH-quinone oxidoreductase subunit L [Halarcobacter mediterraneus]RXK11554.1 NADH-quinone oxidoreductase subunit L [Halarcobacter mediterraneus]
MENYLYIALFAPLLGSLIASLFANKTKSTFIGILSSFFIALSMFASLKLLYMIYTTDVVVSIKLFDWIAIGNLSIPFGFVVDQVSVVMMVVVTIVSTMVHIHSIGYMEHDKSFNRFFAWLGAFVFSMMVLVMSDNFAGLFIGWEGVGLCSWGLIGFWYHKKDQELTSDIKKSPFSTLSPFSSISPSYAANEAFITNRIADLAMLLGMFLIYWNLGSLQYDEVFANIITLDNSLIIAIAILLFIGAMGKSAQFPFNQWLANAMEGPTPVSALIHAATMVTAGVYLVIRANDIFVAVPSVGNFIAILGAFVAIGAALMALVATNIKKIIAFSTLSQLGYMFVAAGLGAYWVALFHLATHAFFKSVLFLGAGNVMHALNDEINIKNMGGLYKHMKGTATIMIIASLALAGIFPLSGFFSKDLILEVAFGTHSYIIWTVLFITAGLTAFYSFRLIMYVFFGNENFKEFNYHPHEAKSYVIVAMSILAILAITAGWFKSFFVEFITKKLPELNAHLDYSTIYLLIVATSAIVLISIAFAIIRFRKKQTYFSSSFENRFCYKLLANQFYMPHFIDSIVNKSYLLLSIIAYKVFDMRVIDLIVDGIAKIIYKSGDKARVSQSGNLSSSLRLMVLGIVFLLVLGIVLAVASQGVY